MAISDSTDLFGTLQSQLFYFKGCLIVIDILCVNLHL